MQKPITIFRGTKGLNNKYDPTRIKDGELAIAYNVDIDNTGRISRRQPFVATAITSSCHSLFFSSSSGIVVISGTLYLLKGDLSYTALLTGIGANRVRCVDVNGTIYFTCRVANGKIVNDALAAWTASPYVGVKTNRSFSDPPKGTLIAHHGGRMYVALEKILWFSEPLAYGWFDYARGYLHFADNLTMVIPVVDGLYVSTTTEVFFIQGTEPKEFIMRKVSKYPSIEGTDVIANGDSVLSGEYSGNVAIWATNDGVFAGFPQGRVVELSGGRLVIPEDMRGSRGLAAFYDSAYICQIEK